MKESNYRVLTGKTAVCYAQYMIKGLLRKLTGQKKETKPRDFEWEKFQQTARQQFRRLKDKGLSIPVVSL